jgi:starvation-inducible DNA-binding protein
MKSSMGGIEFDIEEKVKLLNTLLADEYALYTTTRNAYWNVKGLNLFELHEFFETQYELLDVIINELAERVRSLGHYALGSLKDFLAVTNMAEENHDFSNPIQIIQKLVLDHEAIIFIIQNQINPIADKYNDIETTNFVFGIMKKHEKMAFMLRTFIPQPELINL